MVTGKLRTWYLFYKRIRKNINSIYIFQLTEKYYHHLYCILLNIDMHAKNEHHCQKFQKATPSDALHSFKNRYLSDTEMVLNNSLQNIERAISNLYNRISKNLTLYKHTSPSLANWTKLDVLNLNSRYQTRLSIQSASRLFF